MRLIRGEYYPSLANKVLIYYDNLYCNPDDIMDGDIVYCDTHQILQFKDILNQRNDLILVTHNSDHHLCDGKPSNANGVSVDEFTCYKKWYGQNSYSSRVTPIPIGFENTRWESSFGLKTEWLHSIRNLDCEPSSAVYLNCNRNTNLSERQYCYNIAKDLGCVTIDEPNLSYNEYLKKIKQHKFVLSPRGNGLDCHRTWEILMMKRVPIIKKEGNLESLYRNLPVMFINDWVDLMEINLDKVYKNFSFDSQDYLNFEYWSNLI